MRTGELMDIKKLEVGLAKFNADVAKKELELLESKLGIQSTEEEDNVDATASNTQLFR